MVTDSTIELYGLNFSIWTVDQVDLNFTCSGVKISKISYFYTVCHHYDKYTFKGLLAQLKHHIIIRLESCIQ